MISQTRQIGFLTSSKIAPLVVSPIHLIVSSMASGNPETATSAPNPDPNPSAAPPPPPRTVVCVGDVHGHFTKLRALWANLESSIPPHAFRAALVIFLGDYCDRGPDTRRVIDFFLSLPSAYPGQTHVFLAGNHDFAFAAFVGAVPGDAASFREGWKVYESYEESEGWYRGEGFENMHLQGRRWAGKIKARFNEAKGTEYKGSIFDAAPTFESYGVAHGSADLIKAVPEEHKKFLANMVLVHEEDDVCITTPEGTKHCRLIAVHAGLEGKDVGEQLRSLKAKDTWMAKIEAIAGRKNVWDIPEELIEPPTIVVSGHHGKLHIQGLRLIIDEGGGYPDKPVAAVVLPSLKIIRDTDILPTE